MVFVPVAENLTKHICFIFFFRKYKWFKNRGLDPPPQKKTNMRKHFFNSRLACGPDDVGHHAVLGVREAVRVEQVLLFLLL